MSKPLVYIASPYTKGSPRLNTLFQVRLFNQLMDDDVVFPVAPLWSHFQHLRYPRPAEDWYEYDNALIERLDACLVQCAHIPDQGYFQTWGDSKGVLAERELFKQLGKPVFYTLDDLYPWANRVKRQKPATS